MRFEFAFDPAAAGVLRLAGITMRNSAVLVDDTWFTAHFGPWSVRTPLDNISEASTGGPYRWWKAVGVRLSVGDRGLTFGSSLHAGVCVAFREPVRGLSFGAELRRPAAFEPAVLGRQASKRGAPSHNRPPTLELAATG